LLEQVRSGIVLATPAPQVIAVAVRLALVQHNGADDPHDNAEDEDCDGEGGVVDTNLFSAVVTAAPIGGNDKDAYGHRNTCDDKQSDLGPRASSNGPRWQVVAGREGLGCVEDSKCGRQHAEHNQTAGEVDAAHKELGPSYSYLCSLFTVRQYQFRSVNLPSLASVLW
jgi:hypothetical protein